MKDQFAILSDPVTATQHAFVKQFKVNNCIHESEILEVDMSAFK